MPPFSVITLKRAPFLRLLVALVAGILLQWYIHFTLIALLGSCIVVLALLLFFYFLEPSKKFSLRWAQGVLLLTLFIISGAIITYLKDKSNDPKWIGRIYSSSEAILATIEEPLVNKPKSFKALASVNAIGVNKNWNQTRGKILIYFKKEGEAPPPLEYGSQILFKKRLQQIVNSGNPGAFDYRRYCAFHGIYYQVFIESKDYIVLPSQNKNWAQEQLYSIRSFVTSALKKNLAGKREQGVAEAILIGYRDDLDKDLIQSYSNTGVIHIIAISGLHLGLIYILLVRLLRPLKFVKGNRIARPVIILLVLWIFAIAAGAAPSILRAAVMFSFITIGEAFSRRTSIYNTIAASAFCLLVFNPFLLWEVGFQLSYAAVISIIIFFNPINNWLYFQNKMLDKIWQLSSVTIAAQILTFPLVIYYFHQFPNLFVVANFVVVPIATAVLYGGLFLVIISEWTWLAAIVGKGVSKLLWFMNSFIANIDHLPYSLTDGIKLNILQVLLLYGFITCIAIWLMEKSVKLFIPALICVVVFFAVRTSDVLQHKKQFKMIVYNVPKQTAIDILNGNELVFIGDSTMIDDPFIQNFHFKPARILNRAERKMKFFPLTNNNVITTPGKKIVIVDAPVQGKRAHHKIKADIIVISKNPRLYISDIYDLFECKEIVFDSSNPSWKIEKWKKDCETLHLPFHSVPEEGAFETQL